MKNVIILFVILICHFRIPQASTHYAQIDSTDIEFNLDFDRIIEKNND